MEVDTRAYATLIGEDTYHSFWLENKPPLEPSTTRLKSGHFLSLYVPTGIWSSFLKSGSLTLHTSEGMICLVNLHGFHH